MLDARAEHLDDAETGADGQGPAKELCTCSGLGIGGDVVVLGDQAEQLIAHAAAGPERLMPGLLQPLHNGDGEFAFGHSTRSRFGLEPVAKLK